MYFVSKIYFVMSLKTQKFHSLLKKEETVLTGIMLLTIQTTFTVANLCILYGGKKQPPAMLRKFKIQHRRAWYLQGKDTVS